MNYKNAKYNKNNGIDCEIEHPIHGWIPTTLRIDDAETSELFNIVSLGDVAEYIPYVPTAEELETKAKLEAQQYLNETDWIVTKIAELQIEGGDVEALILKYESELAKRKVMRDLI